MTCERRPLSHAFTGLVLDADRWYAHAVPTNADAVGAVVAVVACDIQIGTCA